jgi:NAD(P)-dependent dehydrogenase (short-subunit alcohol dehydrogenase family)
MASNDSTHPDNRAVQTGRRILLTGPSRGIGRATALELADRGHRLAVMGRPSPEFDETIGLLRGRGHEVVVANADIRDEAAVTAAVDGIWADMGGVEVLINNVGVGRYAPFEELTAEDWDDALSINVAGTARVIRSMLPHMRDAGGGHIINVGSIRSTEAGANWSAYAASKFGLDALTKTLRLELDGTNINVAQICPGGVLTHFGDIDPATKDQSWMPPEAIAQAIATMVEFRGQAWLRDVTIMPDPAGT